MDIDELITALRRMKGQGKTKVYVGIIQIDDEDDEWPSCYPICKIRGCEEYVELICHDDCVTFVDDGCDKCDDDTEQQDLP